MTTDKATTPPLTGAELDKQRELFEAHFGPKDNFAWRTADDKYKVPSLQSAWEIWQAAVIAQARAQQAGAAPVDGNVTIISKCATCNGAGHVERAVSGSTQPPAPVVAAGYKLVPLEPTPEMQQAGHDTPGAHMYNASYRAMVNAAPPTPMCPNAKALDARYSEGYSDGWREGRADLAPEAAHAQQDAAPAELIALLRNPQGVVSRGIMHDAMKRAADLLEKRAAIAPSDATGKGDAANAGDDLNGGMHASIFVKVWGDAGGGDAGRIALANYAFELGRQSATSAADAKDAERPPYDETSIMPLLDEWFGADECKGNWNPLRFAAFVNAAIAATQQKGGA